MKSNILLIMLACGLATDVVAQPRSEREMQAIAAEHLYGALPTHTNRVQHAMPQQLLSTDMVAVYADRYNGTVFVSRDAVFAPVLGWTDRPLTQQDLPDGLQWWLQTITETMQQKKALNDMGTIQHAPVAPDVAPLVTSRWAQDTPYNDKCPVADTWTKRRAQTGCVATAMAQVMNYHEYPAQGKGTGYYTMNGNRKNVRIEGTYDWANMKDSYAGIGDKKDETTDAVATLMYDCGLASGMAYALQGSGATSPNAAAGMVNHFNYDEAAMHCSFRTFCNNDAWLQTIYGELAQQRPLLYMSTDATYGAHAFVIDGCRAQDGYLHVNWGWSGDADGYFDFFNLTPRTNYQEAYGMQGYDFSKDVQSQSMLTGITAPGKGDFAYEAYWCMDGEETISVDGDSIMLHLPTLINYHFQPFEGLVALCIENPITGKGTLQPFYYSAWEKNTIPSLSGWNAMDVPYFKSITDNLDDGDYDLYLMAWDQRALTAGTNPQYIRFPARNDGNENYNVWRMTKKDGHLSIRKLTTPVDDAIETAVSAPRPAGTAIYDLLGRRLSNSDSSNGPIISGQSSNRKLSNGPIISGQSSNRKLSNGPIIKGGKKYLR